MLISLQNNQKQLNNFGLYLLVITTLIGSMVYIGFASLYHFVILGLLTLILCLGINTADFKTDIMKFLLIWLAEAIISTLWAPDKMLALQYVYYIFLINGICTLFHCFLRRENLLTFSHFMVVVLLVCNLIAFWEIYTGKHLLKDYLSTSDRLRLFKYVPAGFFMNPNDFATFIIQILPFSFAGISSPKRLFRILSSLNTIVAFFIICATQSRTQIILILLMYVFFAIIIRKKELIKLSAFVVAASILLYFIYPEFNRLIDRALDSVSGNSLAAVVALEGGSAHIRINLLKNAGHMLLDTFGFGIGAGCHRVVMAEYSSLYFNVGRITVMHNLLGEIFVDYGILAGVLFLAAIINSCRRLYRIYKKAEEDHIRVLAIMLFFSLSMFVVCGISSSSILQLSSVWMTFCFTSAFVKIYKKS